MFRRAERQPRDLHVKDLATTCLAFSLSASYAAVRTSICISLKSLARLATDSRASGAGEDVVATIVATLPSCRLWVGDGGGKKERMTRRTLTMSLHENNLLPGWITDRPGPGVRTGMFPTPIKLFFGIRAACSLPHCAHHALPLLVRSVSSFWSLVSLII